MYLQIAMIIGLKCGARPPGGSSVAASRDWPGLEVGSCLGRACVGDLDGVGHGRRDAVHQRVLKAAQKVWQHVQPH